jgi:glycosyltransferase involved in cell wall biosynthesis
VYPDLPFVNIIIPVYNSEKTILRTLNSVKEQTYSDYEIIVVDDGSSDNSVSLINSFISNYPQLQIKLIIKENGGVSSARNIGLKASKSDWIALLDSDDQWLPNKLERQMQVLQENPHIDFLGTTRNNEILEKIFFKKVFFLQKITPILLLLKYIYATPTVIFKRGIIKNIGFFDETQSHLEDNKFFISVCMKYNCYLLNESLVITGGGKPHLGYSGLSSNIMKMYLGELKNLKFAYNIRLINYFLYLCLLIFSFFRFLRRLFIYKLIS